MPDVNVGVDDLPAVGRTATREVGRAFLPAHVLGSAPEANTSPDRLKAVSR
jgi:hypothetical protein